MSRLQKLTLRPLLPILYHLLFVIVPLGQERRVLSFKFIK